MKQNPVIIRI